jgi:hypothetical protein
MSQIDNRRAVPDIIVEKGKPYRYRLIINLWSDGQVSFNDELARIDFDGDLVDSRLIEWEGDEWKLNTAAFTRHGVETLRK